MMVAAVSRGLLCGQTYITQSLLSRLQDAAREDDAQKMRGALLVLNQLHPYSHQGHSGTPNNDCTAHSCLALPFVSVPFCLTRELFSREI